MSAGDLLIEARSRIAEPGSWTQFASARDADGSIVALDDPNAVRFCAWGSIYAGSNHARHTNPAHFGAVRAFETANGIDEMRKWNDDRRRTHEQVLAAFDKAIEGR